MLAIKKCNTCGEKKPHSEYYDHPSNSDGKLGRCKECHKTSIRANRLRRLDYYREFDRKRGDLPHRIEARKAYAARLPQEYKNELSLKWIKRNPQKRVAHIIAGNAIRDGRLIKQPCEVCGDSVVEAHHDDYSKPLTVRWLCHKCHMKHHKQEREEMRKEIPF